MILFPAIDIYNGDCVRLLYGQFDKVTVYGDPVEMALRWQSQGAQYLHIVDLNGAKTGDSINLDVVSKIVKSVKIPVQMGGGIRTIDDIALRLTKTGVSRVILGTACCTDPKILDLAISRFGAEKIVGGIDAKDGFVAIKGWQENSNLLPIELGKEMKKKGLKYIVYTDISRDGALCGVNTDACVKMTKETGLNVVASGGVSSLSDITALDKNNLYGAILGKAIYSDKFSVEDAIKSISKN